MSEILCGERKVRKCTLQDIMQGFTEQVHTGEDWISCK